VLLAVVDRFLCNIQASNISINAKENNVDHNVSGIEGKSCIWRAGQRNPTNLLYNGRILARIVVENRLLKTIKQASRTTMEVTRTV